MYKLIHLKKYLKKPIKNLLFLIFSLFFSFFLCLNSIQNLSWLNPPWLDPLLRLGSNSDLWIQRSTQILAGLQVEGTPWQNSRTPAVTLFSRNLRIDGKANVLRSISLLNLAWKKSMWLTQLKDWLKCNWSKRWGTTLWFQPGGN